jgi:STE24 endopeptidase
VALCVERLGRVLAPEWEGAAALPALALAAGAVSAPIGIISGRLSRALERRADDYSLELTGASEAFVSFERTIALQNVADLAPPWWVRKLLASHPSTTERIGAAVAHQAA